MQVMRHDASVSLSHKIIGSAVRVSRKSRICRMESPEFERLARLEAFRIYYNSLPRTPNAQRPV